MGRILKVNGEYFVEFYGNGLRFRKKAGADLESAQTKLAEIEASMEESALKVDVSQVTIDMFSTQYLSYAQQVHQVKTFQRLRHVWQHFCDFLNPHLTSHRYLREITPQRIDQYKQHLLQLDLSPKPRFINFSLFLLRDILQYAIKLGWLNDNPTVHIQNVPMPIRKIPATYYEEDLTALTAGLSSEQRDVVEFALCSGMRVEELRHLKWRDVDFSNGEIEVSMPTLQGQTTRVVRMDYRMIEILKRLQDNGSFEEAQAIFKTVFPTEHVHFRYLRNTFARRLIQKGVSLADVYVYLGFDDMAKVYRYEYFLNPDL